MVDNGFAGYLDINGALVHVSDLRQHTSDIHRFREYLPAALELTAQEIGSGRWFRIVESVADPAALQETCNELGTIQRALAGELEAPR